MKLKTFLILQRIYQNYYNSSIRQKFISHHYGYKELIKNLKNYFSSTIGFSPLFFDEFDSLCVVNDLLEKKVKVCYCEIKNNKILFNQINSVYDKKINITNCNEFYKKNYLEKAPDVFVCFSMIVNLKRKQGLVFNEKINEFLKEYSGYKIGIFWKNQKLINHEIEYFNKCNELITFDKIILL